ncbi:MAG TPA: sugar ABC transporter substrate-binding protein [Actinomycetota bacterium]
MKSSIVGDRLGLWRMPAVAVVAALLFAATACSSKSNNASGGGGGGGSCATASKKLNLAFVYASTTDNPFQEMALGAKAAADEDGNVKLTETAPTGIDGPKEVTLFQSAARSATDGVAYMTTFPNLFVRPLQSALSANVPIVAVDALAPKGADVKTAVANSNTALGVALGEAFVKANPNPNGEVVEGLDIPTLPLLQQRMAGFTSVVKQKLPNMKISGPFDTKAEATDNYNAWKAVVQAHPNATAFVGVGGQDGVSLPLIEQQTGKHFLAGSADLPPQALTAVKKGQIFALSSPEHWMKGYIAMRMLIQSKRNCTAIPEGWWNSGNLIVDKSNIDDIIARQQTADSRKAWFQKVVSEQLTSKPIQPLSAAN